MKRSASVILTVSAILAAAVGGLVVGRSNGQVSGWISAVLPAAAKQDAVNSEAAGPIIYYRDPDGQPAYSPVLKKTSAGKAFLSVHSNEDVNFR